MEELVVTEGRDLFPQDEESLTELTEDLSGTNMYTLPQYIFGLVALKKLLLRNCEIVMMELPPEIGELKNLEVLDLEGTEILCLPMEIAKLVNLTCLKVSFYGYANQTAIPKTVLSNLSRLKELIIDVTPYGEWWDVEVKAIIDDLRSLKELTTLKLYLSTAELLENLTLIFPGLANFRFTVGCHEEHFISRLPRDVKEEFNNREKLEKGLKFINGNRIPNEITKVLKHANAFFLQRHWTAESLSEFGHENLNGVKFFLLMECNEFRTIIDSEKLYQGKDGSAESEVFLDSDEAMVLGSLERLIIRYMKNMESIWKGTVGKGSLFNLKSLALHTCPKLTTLFTIDMLSNLINLEELTVEDCPKINSLVSLQNSVSKSVHFLPSLKKISLLHLPGLVSISSGLGIAPKLERMVVFYCPMLEKLSAAEVSRTELKVIIGEKEWWDALKWYESDLSTEDEDYLARLFIPLRRDGDLMAQLIEDKITGYDQGELGSFKTQDCLSNFSEEEHLEEISLEEFEEISSEECEENSFLLEELEEITLEECEISLKGSSVDSQPISASDLALPQATSGPSSGPSAPPTPADPSPNVPIDMGSGSSAEGGNVRGTSTHGGCYVQYNVYGNLFEVSRKYVPLIRLIGRGAKDIVCAAVNSETREKVAIKKIGNAFDNRIDAKRTLREIKLLRHMDHENVIALKDIIRPPQKENFNDVYIVYELMDTDLHQIIRSNQPLSDDHCRYFLYQLLRGLKYVHSANVLHLDLKPSNLLLNANCDLKIGDFRLARTTSETDFMTQYVVTRWYRAPELLLDCSEYTAAIDIWSVGCILGEIMTRQPLFPGKDHVHQLRLITELIGSPDDASLGSLRSDNGRRYVIQLLQYPRQQFSSRFPNMSPGALDLLEKMLVFDPNRRITVDEALCHPYLAPLHDINDEPVCPKPFSFDFKQPSFTEENIKELIWRESVKFNPDPPIQ